MQNDYEPSGYPRASRSTRNRFSISGAVVLLHLSKAYTAVVDLDDLGPVSGTTWTALETGHTVYACSTGKGFLHRWLMGAKSGDDVDHINGDGLDCRRANMRRCSRRENARNSRKRAGTTSQYKGVSLVKGRGRWAAFIRVDYKSIGLGNYETEEEAARAYDAAARYFFKEFARTNFPGSEALSPAELRQRRKPIRRKQSSVVKSRSGYRGVTWQAKCRLWQARIHVDGRTRSLGYHKTAEDAAKAYDQAAREYFGKDARTNFG